MKKSIVISLLTVITLFCTALCSFASTGIVTTDTLRVRKEASTDSSVVGLLSVNDKVEILEEEKNGWYKIQSGNVVGYVAAQYINVLNTTTNVSGENSNKDNNNQASNTETGNNTQTNENTENNQADTSNKETIKVLQTGEKIYITPLISSLVINTLEEEKKIEIINEVNGWSYIQSGTIWGWVRTENIQTKEVEKTTSKTENNTSSQKVGYISGTSVNFRKTPNTSGEIITKLSRNTKIKIIAKDTEWTQVEYNGNTGYVSNDYISDTPIETTSRSSNTRKAKETKETVIDNSSEVVTGGTGSEVIAYAKQYLGYNYRSGGSSPSSGFDCSGFTTYVYKHFGISLSRTSSGQSSNGVAVDKGSMQPGDIICFSGSSGSKKIGHVGLYVGGGKFIHAANSKQGVIISNVTGDGYYFVTARRVI